MNYKMLIATAIIAAATVTAFGIPKVAHADGSSAGSRAAREDFRNHVGFQGSCADHGYDVTLNPGWCLDFKSSYAIQWGVLSLGQ